MATEADIKRIHGYGRGTHVDGRAPWWRFPVEHNLSVLDATRAGLSSAEAEKRLLRDGKNLLADTDILSAPRQLARKLASPMVLLLLFAGIISAATGESTSAALIATVVMLSVLLDLFQERRASKAAERLKLSVALRARVLRDGKARDVPVEALVQGDVVELRAGQCVPADGRVLSAHDLFVTQASLTGESYPVEKHAATEPASDELHEASNALFMGTSTVSGEAAMLVCGTGKNTQIGLVAHALAKQRDDTAFERGIREYGNLIVKIVSVLVVFVALTNLAAHKPFMESLLFALALAVGLTPELLPMVVTITLSRGAMRLADCHVVVKRLSAVQDLGAVDVFCTDKTGTLTEGAVSLTQHVDIKGGSSEVVLRYAWLNSAFETGMRTPLEDAILSHDKESMDGWTKIDEVPFDFERKRLSVLLARKTLDGEQRYLVLKGAPEEVMAHCSQVMDATGTTSASFDEVASSQAHATLSRLEQNGYRILAVAIKAMPAHVDDARLDDECELVLVGFAAFLDPPKPSSAEALGQLRRYGITVKIITGDSEQVTQYICNTLGIPVTGTVMGRDIEQMDDNALRHCVETANLFCRVSPMQKSRIILALKSQAHVVGYLGDGINDATALYNADVGISVDTAVDVAREAADLILLKKDLQVLVNGVQEGRRTFANVQKYILMGSSSNFGNMFSMAGAALFLPFLPMQPAQILLNNMLYDLSESTIPMDTTDPEEIMVPPKWDIRFLRDFMLVMGPISSLFDFVIFYLMLNVFHMNAVSFQTGWFLESLATQVLVIFIIRTRLNPLKSRPHPALALAAAGVLGFAFVSPFTPLGSYFGFVPLPPAFYGTVILLTLAYLFLVNIVKSGFYARRRPDLQQKRVPAAIRES